MLRTDKHVRYGIERCLELEVRVQSVLQSDPTLLPAHVCTVIKHVTRRLRRHWPKTRLVWRGDSHYGRVEAMDWAEEHGADYSFGLAGNVVNRAGRRKSQHRDRFSPNLRPQRRARELLHQARSGFAAILCPEELLDRLREIRQELGTDQVFDVVGEIMPANLLERLFRDMYARRLDEHDRLPCRRWP